MNNFNAVSIHAPWEGCDEYTEPTLASMLTFQFTHPGKGATPNKRDTYNEQRVSIHAPWEGCDRT